MTNSANVWNHSCYAGHHALRDISKKKASENRNPATMNVIPVSRDSRRSRRQRPLEILTKPVSNRETKTSSETFRSEFDKETHRNLSRTAPMKFRSAFDGKRERRKISPERTPFSRRINVTGGSKSYIYQRGNKTSSAAGRRMDYAKNNSEVESTPTTAWTSDCGRQMQQSSRCLVNPSHRR